MTYTIWCEINNCTHGHCPEGCEHPQPATYDGGNELLCGRCWYKDKQRTVITPCVLGENCTDTFIADTAGVQL